MAKRILIKLCLTIPALMIGLIKGVVYTFEPVYTLWMGDNE